MRINPMLMTDFYKISHRIMGVEGTEKIYSTFTPRSSRIEGIDRVVFFGLQGFIKEYLIEYFNEQFFNKNKEVVVNDYKRIIENTLGKQSATTEHIEALHDLGYLPIKICALPEGSLVPIRCPMFTIENTHKDFYWLTNFLETLISACVWKPCTSTTIVKQYRDICEEWAERTAETKNFIDFQCHNFSYRGMHSNEDGIVCGAGHMLYFKGSDTIPSIQYLENHYNASVENEIVGVSCYASEHSIQCQYQDDYTYFKNLITKVIPNGLVSIVADGYDYWGVFKNVIPKLKEDIMKRDGKVVIRPDCYDDKTKILTNKGWKLFKDLDKEKDLVAEFKNGFIKFVKPLKFYDEEYNGKMINFKSQKNKIDLLVTPNHKMVIHDKKQNKFIFIEAEETKYNSYKNLPVAGIKKGYINTLSEFEKLMIAFQADGRCKLKEGDKSGNYVLEFNFAKERKIKKTALNLCKWKL
jgi:nicotinamide phosphoribosyltransferase